MGRAGPEHPAPRRGLTKSRASAVTAPQARDAAPLLAALGDETRLRLIVRHEYLDRISQQWDEALDRLRKFVED